MSKFWELMERSVIVQALITFSLIGVVIYLVATGQEVPDLISSLTLLVVGFYFGSKVENVATRNAISKITQ